MRVLDLRPWLERQVASRSAVVGPASPPARLAGAVADRLAARRAARRRPPAPGALIVAVGNLRVGGTGKTPVTMALAADLADRGVTGAIVTRGYGAAEPGPLMVAAADPRGGDEARLMAGALAERPWTVVQSRHRQPGLAVALGAEPAPQVVIVEDGFQTGEVGRHLDVLILDSWTHHDGTVVPRTGCALPFGPYRETARGADRAQVWLLETEDPGRGPANGAVVCGFRRRGFLRSVAGGRPDAAASPYGLIAGLARPERFEATAAEVLPTPAVLSVRCRDHSPFDRRLVRRILAEGAAAGVATWVTTAKDWVKLEPVWPPDAPLLMADLTVTWTGSKALPDLVEERLRALGAGGPEI